MLRTSSALDLHAAPSTYTEASFDRDVVKLLIESWQDELPPSMGFTRQVYEQLGAEWARGPLISAGEQPQVDQMARAPSFEERVRASLPKSVLHSLFESKNESDSDDESESDVRLTKEQEALLYKTLHKGEEMVELDDPQPVRRRKVRTIVESKRAAAHTDRSASVSLRPSYTALRHQLFAQVSLARARTEIPPCHVPEETTEEGTREEDEEGTD